MAERGLDCVEMAVVIRHHDHLRRLAEETDGDQVQAILALATAVMLHGALEPAHLGGVLRFVDPAVLAELANDHSSLAEDIVCLRELRADDPGSADARLLSGAIRRRVLSHLKRDARVLYRPWRRLQGC